jgi:hydroxymethylglutaryl-CoA reductase
MKDDKMQRSSRLSGFYQLGQEERLDLVKSHCELDDATIKALKDSSALPFDLVNRLVENAIGGFTVPLGIATNMIIDGQDILIPMAT